MQAGVLKSFIHWNQLRSARLAAPWIERGRRRAATAEFAQVIVPALLRPGMQVLDAGSGKHPHFNDEMRRRFSLRVTGLDIDHEQLRQAPPGAYDDAFVGDVATVRIPEKYDLILSQMVLEHVRDVPAAIANMAAALKPGGVMTHVMPNRRALFARINQLLGEKLGRRALYTIFPERAAVAGFPAFYKHCTPKELRACCEAAGLEVLEIRPYFASDYFSFLVPLFVVDGVRQLALEACRATRWCEYFTITARRPIAAGEQVLSPAA